MILRFALVNFLTAALIVAAWQLGLGNWISDLPQSTWLMIGLLGLVWLAGIGFTLARQWGTVYHVANLLPILGLVLTGLGFQIARHAAIGAPDEHAFMFTAIIQSLSTTFLSVALMAHLREVAWWVGGEHI